MWGSRLLLAFVIVALALVATGFYRAWNSEGPWKTVSALESLQPESVTYMEDEEVFVVVEGDRVRALSARDPHMNHLDLFCERSGLFEGAHGEKFDRWGVYFAGPAPRNMDQVALRVQDGVVEIDPHEITEGGPRPARAADGSHALEPIGAFCDPGALGGRPGFYVDPRSPAS